MTQKPLDQTLVEKLRRLDDSINANENTSISARWQYGRSICVYHELRPFGEKKQLPKGVLKQLASELDVHLSDVSARMKFARMYDTEEKLSTVIESFRSWFAIKQHALSDTTRTSVPKKTPLQRALDLIRDIEPDTLTKADIPVMAAIVKVLGEFKDSIQAEEGTGVGVGFPAGLPAGVSVTAVVDAASAA
jgi:hypothetical protein